MLIEVEGQQKSFIKVKGLFDYVQSENQSDTTSL